MQAVEDQCRSLITIIFINKNAFQSNANHPLTENMSYIKYEGCRYFYFDLDVTFTLMCEPDFIHDL